MVSLHFEISFVYQVIYNTYRKFYILSSFSSFSSISSFSFYPWGKNENEETEETEETEESIFLRLIDRSFCWWGTQGEGGLDTWVISQLIDWLTDWLTDWSIHWAIILLMNKLIDNNGEWIGSIS